MTELEKAQSEVNQLAAEVTALKAELTSSKVQLAYQRTVYQGLLDYLQTQCGTAEAEIVQLKSDGARRQSDFEHVNNQLQTENNRLLRLLGALADEDRVPPTGDAIPDQKS